MAQNFLFAWPNRAEGATLTGGAWSATLPLANLKTRFSFEPGRTVNTLPASTCMDVALDAPRGIKCVALLRHNLRVGARYRLRLSATAGDYSAPLWDSGTRDVWDSMFPFGTKGWGDEGWWGGKPSAEDIAGYPSLLLCVLPTAVRARYLRDGQINLAALLKPRPPSGPLPVTITVDDAVVDLGAKFDPKQGTSVPPVDAQLHLEAAARIFDPHITADIKKLNLRAHAPLEAQIDLSGGVSVLKGAQPQIEARDLKLRVQTTGEQANRLAPQAALQGNFELALLFHGPLTALGIDDAAQVEQIGALLAGLRRRLLLRKIKLAKYAAYQMNRCLALVPPNQPPHRFSQRTHLRQDLLGERACE